MASQFGTQFKTSADILAEMQAQAKAQQQATIQANISRASTPDEIAGTGIGNFLGALGVKAWDKYFPSDPTTAQQNAQALGGILGQVNQAGSSFVPNQNTPPIQGGIVPTQQSMPQSQIFSLQAQKLQSEMANASPENQQIMSQMLTNLLGQSAAARKEEDRIAGAASQAAGQTSFLTSIETKHPRVADAVRAGMPIKDALSTIETREKVAPLTAPKMIEYERNGQIVTELWNPKTGQYEIKATSPVQANFMSVEDSIEVAGETKRSEEINKKRAAGIAERESVDMAAGVGAIDATPVLNRSLELLNQIETGNTEGLLLKGKRFLGVESADEAELINNLNKRVISQLKPVFGAQFTAKEGEWLKAIEASEGKSTVANIRLMKVGVNLAIDKAERGLEAAKFAGDGRKEAEFKRFLKDNKRLELGEAVEEDVVQPSPEVTLSPNAAKYL